jgi:hypothetical protein
MGASKFFLAQWVGKWRMDNGLGCHVPCLNRRDATIKAPEGTEAWQSLRAG